MFNNSQNQIFQYNGSLITFQKGDSVMVNATEMAKHFGKEPKFWLMNKSTTDYLNELSKVRNLTLADLVQVTKGGNNPGTWMHEDVAMEFARWLSPAFAIWCNDRIKELLQYGMTATQPTLEQMINNPDLVISIATQLKNEREEKQRLQAKTAQQQSTIALQSAEIQKASPKVNYYNEHLQSVNTVTATQIAKEMGLDAHKLNTKLKECGIIYRQSGQWLLHAPYSTLGLHSTRTQTFTRNDGYIGNSIYTVWTQKGRRFLHALHDNGWNVRKAIKQIGESKTVL